MHRKLTAIQRTEQVRHDRIQCGEDRNCTLAAEECQRIRKLYGFVLIVAVRTDQTGNNTNELVHDLAERRSCLVTGDTGNGTAA